MADRPTGYGLTKELSDKNDAKYDLGTEKDVVEWISGLTGIPKAAPGRENTHAWLKDGYVLCTLMNSLAQKTVCKPNDLAKVKLQAMRRNKEMENISMFLREAEKYGMRNSDLFQTVDLYEGQNMPQVLSTLYKLGGVAKTLGAKGSIGVKTATANERNLDEEKLKEGRNVIGLQMGTNQVASQSGMTAYGLGRQLTPQMK